MLRTSGKGVFALERCCKKCSYTKDSFVWAPRSSQRQSAAGQTLNIQKSPEDVQRIGEPAEPVCRIF